MFMSLIFLEDIFQFNLSSLVFSIRFAIHRYLAYLTSCTPTYKFCNLNYNHNIQTNFALYNQNVVEFLRELEQANNPESSPDTLLTIANDKNVSVCFAVAQNPNTPALALEKLAFHKSRFGFDLLLPTTKIQQ